MAEVFEPLLSIPPPADVGNFAYLIMFYEGVGNLFPWNAFITASGYYAARFCGTSFEDSFENYFSITYTLSQTIGLVLAVLYAENFSLNRKITLPLVAYSAIFAITTMLVGIPDIDPTLLFFVTLLSAFCSGCVGALLSGGLFSLGAMFPPSYTGALMNGQGLAGLVVSLSALFTTLGSPPTDLCDDDAAQDDDGDCAYSTDFAALAYFLIATLVLATCMASFIVLKRLPFTRYYYGRAMGHGDQAISNPLLSENQSEDHRKSSSVTPLRIASNADDSMSGSAHQQSPLTQHTTSNNSDTMEESDSDNNNENNKLTPISVENILATSKKLYAPLIGVLLTFTVTISVFPSLTVLLESTDRCANGNSTGFSTALFTPFLFVLYNLGDFIGRILAGHFPLLLSTPSLPWAALVRAVMVPLLLLSNIGGSQLPAVFKNDVCACFFMLMLSTSNGYVASVCMMRGPDLVDTREKGLAGTIMILSLTVGLLLGACLSFIVVLISQGSV